MAAIAAVYRVSARAATQLRTHGARRAFTSGQASLAAQNFNMPALSPTMTEGNIATWKIKEGDSFSAGDVILEIETDKAQMDVEAQDDGILAKITVGDGSKAVQVGARIGVTAEPGDDLSSLEMPAEESPAPKKAEEPKSKPSPKEERMSAPPAKSDASKKASSGKAAKQTYPLYPSVQHLLEVNGLPKGEADKIPATGPNGRLLKGDVLAYVGKIEGSYPSELADRFTKLAHLDLSNIKPMAKKEAPKKAAAEAPQAPGALHVEVSLPVDLGAMMHLRRAGNVSITLDTVIARAAEAASANLPRSKTVKPTADELFNAVLGLDKVAAKPSRGHLVPQVAVRPRPRALKKPDLLDIIAENSATARTRTSISSIPANSEPLQVLSVSVPKGDEERGRVFLKRVKTSIEDTPVLLVY
ncbi:hypothetical protein EJ02DRAFT_457709 [Clathrospora elynae]|uniref:Pyruvate dehydrogenase protein x component n=1 Tax=Clathrospora elynae TaxID=706981 RepID=A0A6A5SFM0_9PLEO|nr:hypothetical protein EJ02DRAFT_457709 [Clathrospora elynae]